MTDSVSSPSAVPPASGPADVAASAASSFADEAASAALSELRTLRPLSAQLEALLIVAEEPLDAPTLAAATDRPVREVSEALAGLQRDYDEAGRGFELREIAGGYRFYVREEFDPLIDAFLGQQSPARLSQAALETLAVIAYRQPITRGEIAQIRAVNVDSVVRTLLARGLITEVGQHPETTATLYGTTQQLLRHLGIGHIGELPPIAPLLPAPGEGLESDDTE